MSQTVQSESDWLIEAGRERLGTLSISGVRRPDFQQDFLAKTQDAGLTPVEIREVGSSAVFEALKEQFGESDNGWVQRRLSRIAWRVPEDCLGEVVNDTFLSLEEKASSFIASDDAFVFHSHFGGWVSSELATIAKKFQRRFARSNVGRLYEKDLPRVSSMDRFEVAMSLLQVIDAVADVELGPSPRVRAKRGSHSQEHFAKVQVTSNAFLRILREALSDRRALAGQRFSKLDFRALLNSAVVEAYPLYSDPKSLAKRLRADVAFALRTAFEGLRDAVNVEPDALEELYWMCDALRSWERYEVARALGGYATVSNQGGLLGVATARWASLIDVAGSGEWVWPGARNERTMSERILKKFDSSKGDGPSPIEAAQERPDSEVSQALIDVYEILMSRKGSNDDE